MALQRIFYFKPKKCKIIIYFSSVSSIDFLRDLYLDLDLDLYFTQKPP